MKKTTLLSLLTATALVATTSATYAVWDNTEANTSGTVKFREPVTINVPESIDFTADNGKLHEAPSSSQDVEFTIQNTNGLADTLTITPKVTLNGTQSEWNEDNYTLTIEESKNGYSSTLTESDGIYTDSVEQATESKKYKVTLQLTNTGISKYDGGEKDIHISLTAELSNSQPGEESYLLMDSEVTTPETETEVEATTDITE